MSDHQWKPLQWSQPNGGPDVKLFRFLRSSAGFKLLVTDVVEVWETSRSSDEVISQAALEKANIDPSEDASQYEVLLQKLSDCLNGRNGGICVLHGSDTRLKTFELRATISLPAPLGTLAWTFLLNRKNQRTTGAFSQELLFPALSETARGQQQVQSLKYVIQQKDHVIRRLLDKIEGSSIDLSTIFPGIGGGKHRQQRLNNAQIASTVPGLAAFDETAWSHEQEVEISGQGPTSVGIVESLGNEKIQSFTLRGAVSDKQASSTDTESEGTSTSIEHEAANSRSPRMSDATDASLKNDARTGRHVPATGLRSSSSESNDGHTTTKSHHKLRARLGRIGGRQKGHNESLASFKREPKVTTTRFDDPPGSQKLSRAGVASSATPEQTPQSTPSRRLGKIGAGARRSADPISTAEAFDIHEEEVRSNSNTNKTSEALESTQKVPLGSAAQTQSRIPPKSPHESPSSKSETLEEKRARKREEVKKIEEVPPGKKKRKF